MSKLYLTNAELARATGLSKPTICKRVAGIRKEIAKGRYNRYALAGNLISMAVFLDYNKYWEMLEDKNMRKSVPEFNLSEATKYLQLQEGA